MQNSIFDPLILGDFDKINFLPAFIEFQIKWDTWFSSTVLITAGGGNQRAKLN